MRNDEYNKIKLARGVLKKYAKGRAFNDAVIRGKGVKQMREDLQTAYEVIYGLFIMDRRTKGEDYDMTPKERAEHARFMICRQRGRIAPPIEARNRRQDNGKY